jgi:hypothetical protein
MFLHMWSEEPGDAALRAPGERAPRVFADGNRLSLMPTSEHWARAVHDKEVVRVSCNQDMS